MNPAFDIVPAPHGTPDWLAARQSGIGGSDAAAVLGLSKWKTPLAVWKEKRGDGAPVIDNEPMLWGRVLEPAIRQQYAERTGREVRVLDGILRHQRHPFMLASLDGVTDDNRLVEIKTARSGAEWGEPGTDEIPQAYMIQVQHYMAVTGLVVADLAVLIAGSDFRLYEVPADPELQNLIIEAEAEFWDHVEKGIPPDPVTHDEVSQRYRVSREGVIEATTELLDAYNALKSTRATIKELAETEDELTATIKKAMTESDTLTHAGKTLATWRSSKPSQRFDSAAFKAAHPALYAEFCKTADGARPFLLK